jgi:hypothetical protein
MSLRIRLLAGLASALVLLVPVAAQQPDGLPAPTTKEPLRFTAILQTQGADMGHMGRADIVIERWTPDSERKSLVDLLAGTSFKSGGQDKLLRALQNVKPRTGYIRTPNSLGWDLKYARDFVQADGTRQIVIATDKPVSFGAAFAGAESLDYPFTLIEMRMGAGNKGEGKMLARTAVGTKDGHLQLENYGDEPIKLTEITLEEQKKKKS